MKRRRFLTQTALFGASSLAAVGTRGWLWQGSAKANQTKAASTPRLIVVMLRGAVDGLNVVVPYKETQYYQTRPSIAIARPGENNGALNLDGQFGLHPGLEALMPAWESGNLAFVHASGSPAATRSHFQAQDYLENGTPGNSRTNDGWLNRLIGALPNSNLTQAVNMGSGSTLPLIFKGSETVSNLTITPNGRPSFSNDQRGSQTAFDQLYARNSRLASTYEAGRQAQGMLRQELAVEEEEASRGAPTPQRFVSTARALARIMKGDTNTQIAFMELGGWDTHVNERGTLNRLLPPLGEGLATLTQELGDLYQDTTIVVMSEFGRTVAENGNSGTDHGYGNAMWIMGGQVRGRKVYGEWPGLSELNLHQSRDLAITTDYRDVVMSILTQQFSLNDSALAQVFPDYRQQNRIALL